MVDAYQEHRTYFLSGSQTQVVYNYHVAEIFYLVYV